MNTYFKPDCNTSKKVINIAKYCFPEIFNVNYVNNNKKLVVLYIGKHDKIFDMIEDEYNKLDMVDVGTYPNSDNGEVELSTMADIKSFSLIIHAKAKIDYRTIKILFRGVNFGHWGNEIKNQYIIDREYTDEENEKFFKLLKNDSY